MTTVRELTIKVISPDRAHISDMTQNIIDIAMSIPDAIIEVSITKVEEIE